MAVNQFWRDGPFSLRDLQSEFDRMVDRLWHGGINTAPLDGQDWAPSLDLADEGDHYLMRVELPGMSADQVEVSVLGQTLTVRGVKPSPRKPGEQRRYLQSECRFGSFRRSAVLDEPVEAEQVAATCRDGVLEIRLPKRDRPRGVTIRVAPGPTPAG